MGDCHLYLDDRGLCFHADSSLLFYDELHQQVNLFLPLPNENTTTIENDPNDNSHLEEGCTKKNLGLYSIPLETLSDAINGPFLEISNTSTFIDVKMSMNQQFFALQSKEAEVVVVDIATKLTYIIHCNSKPGSRILSRGVLWTVNRTNAAQELVIITSNGLEQYRVSSSSCKFVRSLTYMTTSFWYAFKKNVVLLCTGQEENVLRPFLFHGSTPHKIKSLRLSSRITTKDLYLVEVYSVLHAIHVDTHASQLVLYAITREDMIKTHSLRLDLPGGSPIDLSVVDELLVCHSREFNVSLIFDIQVSHINTEAFINPLPIGLDAPLKQHHQKHKNVVIHKNFMNTEPKDSMQHAENAILQFSSTTSSNKDDATQFLQGVFCKKGLRDIIDRQAGYSNQWSFLQPHFVMLTKETNNMEIVMIKSLRLNLVEIATCAAHNPNLVSFLLRRGSSYEGKAILLPIIYNLLVEEENFNRFPMIFTMINECYLKALVDR